MYTRQRLMDILGDRLDNPNATGAVDDLAVVYQVRRLMALCGAGLDTPIGTRP